MIAGAGTAAVELLRQAPELKVILVPAGGGGLAAGTVMAAKAINPDITVIGVEPRAGADTAASFDPGTSSRCRRYRTRSLTAPAHQPGPAAMGDQQSAPR